jgi:hypothetical protein
MSHTTSSLGYARRTCIQYSGAAFQYSKSQSIFLHHPSIQLFQCLQYIVTSGLNGKHANGIPKCDSSVVLAEHDLCIEMMEKFSDTYYSTISQEEKVTSGFHIHWFDQGVFVKQTSDA